MKNRFWLLTNGLGSYSMGSADESICRVEYALFTALLRPPLRREMCVRRVHETVYLENGWQPLTGQKGGGDSLFESQFQLVNNLPTYQYTGKDFVIEKHLFMEPGKHALYVQYKIARATTKCRLRVHPLLILPVSYFDADFDES
ncbi:MAG: glycogen debranching enzyme N-terminal domain-containing protein, partial [bacterium]